MDIHGGSLDVDRRGHEDFLQTGNTESHVGSSVTSQVEGIEGHLSGGLAHRLSSDSADILARVHYALHVFHVVHFAEPVTVDRLVLLLKSARMGLGIFCCQVGRQFLL